MRQSCRHNFSLILWGSRCQSLLPFFAYNEQPDTVLGVR
nr:MAG TPA: hypothetical protein [Bacteriophage sp.]